MKRLMRHALRVKWNPMNVIHHVNKGCSWTRCETPTTTDWAEVTCPDCHQAWRIAKGNRKGEPFVVVPAVKRCPDYWMSDLHTDDCLECKRLNSQHVEVKAHRCTCCGGIGGCVK